MKSTNKAFTLIELLAVILILGIIALIAIPAVSSIVKESKDSAAKASAENYVNAAETAVMKKNLVYPFNPTTCDVSKTTLSCDGYEPIQVDIKGDLPESGTITFKNNIVDTYSLKYSEDKTITKSSDGSVKMNVYKVYANGTPIFFNVTTGKQCTNYTESQSATEVKSGCMKFYTFNDREDSKTVNLLLDHNTTLDIEWNSNLGWAVDEEQGPLTLLVQLHRDTDDWKGTETPEPSTYSYINPTGIIVNKSNKSAGTGYSYTIDYNGYKARLISADEIAHITGNDVENNWSSTTGDSFYFDSNTDIESNTCRDGKIKGCKYGWLYDRTYKDCERYGCLNKDLGGSYGYLTSSANFSYSNTVYAVKYWGVLDFAPVRTSYGLRPVITVSKSKLS